MPVAHNPYKHLAIAVILQAVKDAVGAPPKLRKCSSVHTLAHHELEVHLWRKNRDEARFLLTQDKEIFPFWCQVAELDCKAVRMKLLPQLGRVRLRELIKSLNATQTKVTPGVSLSGNGGKGQLEPSFSAGLQRYLPPSTAELTADGLLAGWTWPDLASECKEVIAA